MENGAGVEVRVGGGDCCGSGCHCVGDGAGRCGICTELGVRGGHSTNIRGLKVTATIVC